jgi:hypothetical protein
MLLVVGIFHREDTVKSVKKTNSPVSQHIVKNYYNKLYLKEFLNTAPCASMVNYIDGIMPVPAVPDLL